MPSPQLDIKIQEGWLWNYGSLPGGIALNDLVQRGIFQQSGTTGEGTFYKLKGT